MWDLNKKTVYNQYLTSLIDATKPMNDVAALPANRNDFKVAVVARKPEPTLTPQVFLGGPFNMNGVTRYPRAG
jgi:hypothetical protein